MTTDPVSDDRYARWRGRRMALVAQASRVARQELRTAVPVHQRNPAVQTGLACVEVGALAGCLATGSTLLFVLFVAATVAYLIVSLADARAVIGFDAAGHGTLLAANRAGRPTAVRGPASLDRGLPTAPGGLATAVHLNGARWWVDRSSYAALRAAASPAPAHDDDPSGGPS